MDKLELPYVLQTDVNLRFIWADAGGPKHLNVTLTRANYAQLFFSSRRRHTRYWRDWSSDVCLFRSRFIRSLLWTSGVNDEPGWALPEGMTRAACYTSRGRTSSPSRRMLRSTRAGSMPGHCTRTIRSEIGRASCRERV